MSGGPIFVHSLFRSGSTYMFGVFRRSGAGYWCYQEPLNEFVRHAADAPGRLLEINAHDSSLLRHPILEKPYFWEFYQIRDAIAPLFRKEFSYDTFFMTDGHPSFPYLKSYFQCLIDNASGRPVLQCCRSFGRIAALRDAFAGTHIHLWRNPQDQWWSYQVGDYFDATTQLILNAADPPPVLAAVKGICGIPDFHDRDVDMELAHARRHALGSRESYLSFYALWMYSFLESERVADLSINIDSLSTSDAYRQQTLSALARRGVDGLDFSDCSTAQAQFSADDVAFFNEAEDRIHVLFQALGRETASLESALVLRAEHRPVSRGDAADLAASANRVRNVALRQMDARAAAQRQVAEKEFALAESQRTVETRSEELATARAQSVQLEADMQGMKAQLESAKNALSRLDTQLAAKDDDLATARAKIEELNRDVTRWWTMADGLDRHLKAVYATRSWRVTAPLRRIAAALKI
jgi:hypothetical protein